jgi:hypothetical protein
MSLLKDGMIIIWAPSSTPQTATYGSDLTADELQYEKEYWKPRTTFRYGHFHARFQIEVK